MLNLLLLEQKMKCLYLECENDVTHEDLVETEGTEDLIWTLCCASHAGKNAVSITIDQLACREFSLHKDPKMLPIKDRLFLVHCGFYDHELCDGAWEGHANFFVVGTDVPEIKLKVKRLPEYSAKRMHIDGIQEIMAVEGRTISLEFDKHLNNETIIINHKHRELAPAKPLQTP